MARNICCGVPGVATVGKGIKRGKAGGRGKRTDGVGERVEEKGGRSELGVESRGKTSGKCAV